MRRRSFLLCGVEVIPRVGQGGVGKDRMRGGTGRGSHEGETGGEKGRNSIHRLMRRVIHMVELLVGFTIGFLVGALFLMLVTGHVIATATKPLSAALTRFSEARAANDRFEADLALRDAIRASEDDQELADALDAFVASSSEVQIGQKRLEFALAGLPPTLADQAAGAVPEGPRGHFRAPGAKSRAPCDFCRKVRSLFRA